MKQDDLITMSHGSGGSQSHELVEKLFLRYLGQPSAVLEDATELSLARGKVVFTTDAFVVKPLCFPGGDIGRLAVCGTVNDLAMRGAQPAALSAAFILEEGLPLDLLERVVISMAAAAREAGVRIVTGDTKVVEHGSGDGVFITTSGVGVVAEGISISAANARAGDAILLSGTIGDHGLTIMTQREGLQFESPLQSDCAPLNSLVADLLSAAPGTRVLRDPTRGGLATALNEIAQSSKLGIEIDEILVPVTPAVKATSEILGLDPCYVANEGKLIAFVPPHQAEAALAALRVHPLGTLAAQIGYATQEHPGRVALRTVLGTRRVLGMLVGEHLPRIC
ncbi:MAG: hydrogenase expression/formation protein HypE [Chloroflexi bacterium]|nr:hydrogenase expression/formation protein HypE [Chloroflexota bacterium]